MRIFLISPPVSNTFFDKITGRSLCQGEDGVKILFQFRHLCVQSYTPQERGQEVFSGIMEQFVLAACANQPSLHAASHGVKAAMVAAWFRKTRPFPSCFDVYIGVEDVGSEIARRGNVLESERFAPLFLASDSAWRQGYPVLAEAFPKACTAAQALALVASLLNRWNVAAEVKDVTLNGLCDLVAPLISHLDTAELRGADNDKRLVALAKALMKSALPVPSGDVDISDKALSGGGRITEAWEEILMQDDYKALVRILEPLNVQPLSFVKVAAAMMRAKSCIGLAFLNGKTVPQPLFQVMAAARQPSVIQSVLNEVLAVDTHKVAHPEWASLTTAELSKKFIAGKAWEWEDLWRMVLPAIAKRCGQAAVDRFAKARASSLPTDPERLELASELWASLYEAIGYKGREAGSFRSFVHTIRENAKTIKIFPECPQKLALFEKLQKAANLVLDEAAVAYQLMLNTPLSVARRPITFCPEDGAGQRDLLALATLLVRYREDMDLGILSVGSYAHQDAKKERKERKDSWEQDYEWSEGWKKQKVEEWGAAALHAGVWTSDEGVMFGSSFVAYPDHAQLQCLAALAPKTFHQRHRWCTNPGECTEELHKRPAGVEEVVSRSESRDGSVWTVISGGDLDLAAPPMNGSVVPYVPPDEHRDHGGHGRGIGKGKRGGSGKGSGKGKGGKGGAKGGAKGSGKAKGGGKGGQKGGRGGGYLNKRR